MPRRLGGHVQHFQDLSSLHSDILCALRIQSSTSETYLLIVDHGRCWICSETMLVQFRSCGRDENTARTARSYDNGWLRMTDRVVALTRRMLLSITDVELYFVMSLLRRWSPVWCEVDASTCCLKGIPPESIVHYALPESIPLVKLIIMSDS